MLGWAVPLPRELCPLLQADSPGRGWGGLRILKSFSYTSPRIPGPGTTLLCWAGSVARPHLPSPNSSLSTPFTFHPHSFPNKWTPDEEFEAQIG